MVIKITITEIIALFTFRSSNTGLVDRSATVHFHSVFTDENGMSVEVEVTDLEDLNDEFNHILEAIVSGEKYFIEFKIA